MCTQHCTQNSTQQF